MKVLKHFVFALVLLAVFTSQNTEARFRGGRSYTGFYGPHWRQGYWFHGAYLNRAGWWWVVGPTWYYYPAPFYPYPPAGSVPVYIVQAPIGTLPPPAPLPSSTTPGAVGSQAGMTPPVASAQPKNAALPPTGKQTQAFSYYCEKLKNYYPNVSDCPDGWVATPVKPPN